MEHHQVIKVLVVARGKDAEGHFAPFVSEQVKALEAEGVAIVRYSIMSKGLAGYISSFRGIVRTIRATRPDVVHAHYGLSGLCANLQRRVPVVTTYHGSDIHSRGWRLALSKLAVSLSARNIFVSEKLLAISGARPSASAVVPCGVDMDTMQSLPRDEAKRRCGRDYRYVVFAGSFANDIKNPQLAQAAMALVPGVRLVELAGYTRAETSLLINGADCLLLTSHREGSPQVIKEAMACGTPIVSVDVGDVRQVTGALPGCYIADADAGDIARKVQQALSFEGKTEGRQRIKELGLDNRDIARRLISIYRAATGGAHAAPL